MKNSRKVLGIMLSVALFILLACQEETITPVNSNDHSTTIQIDGTLFSFSPTQFYNNPESGEAVYSQFSASGSSDAQEMEQLTISHYYLAVLQKDGKIQYKEGEFNIYGTSENSLFGTYFGTGYMDDSGFSAEWTLKVEGGTGVYEGATGYLMEYIESEQDAPSDLVYKVELSGSIYIPGKPPIIK